MPPTTAVFRHEGVIRGTVYGCGSGEATTLQPFGQQTQPVAGRPQQFYLTATAAPEDEDLAGHRVVFQCRLHFCRQPVEAVAHVGDTGNQPDFSACRKDLSYSPSHQFAQDSGDEFS
jgi:hypothetical protein